MMIALTLGLLTTLFAPPGIEGERSIATNPPVVADRPIGIEFTAAIPTHNRGLLQSKFTETLALACTSTPVCVEDCPVDATTMGVEIDGKNRNYSLRWVANDPRLEQPLTLDSTCELCSLVEVEQLFATDMARLCTQIAAIDSGPGELFVSTSPGRARLRVDGQRVGRTPWSGALAFGEHRIQVRAPGYRPQRHDVAIEGNVALYRHYTLVSTLTPRPRPTWPAWSSMGLGLALSIAGTALIALDGQPWSGRCSGANLDIAGHCRYLLHTRPLGIGLAAAGAGAIAGGVGLMIWAQRDPGQTSAGIRVGGRF